MESSELNKLLLEAFPEIDEEFERYTSWQDGLETGCFLTHEDLLLLLVRTALDRKDKALLSRVGVYVEQLITSQDELAVNIAIVGVLEGLKANGDMAIRDYLGAVSLKEFDLMKY